MLPRVSVGPQPLTIQLRDLPNKWFEVKKEDAGRLVEALEARPPESHTVVGKIEQATKLDPGTVLLRTVREEDAVLAALTDMKNRAPLPRELGELFEALQERVNDQS